MIAKFARFIGLSVALYLLLLSSLLSTSAAPRRQADLAAGEPNNNFGTANAIDIGFAVEGTIAPTGDVDWFSFTVNHQGELQVSITNVAEELAISVRVWDSNKSTVSGWFAPLAAGGDTFALVDLNQAGRYYLEVANDDSAVESSQPYILRATFTATADSAEPNNNFGAAVPLAVDQVYAANILPVNDTDWYAITVDGHGELNLEIGNVAVDLAVSVRVWNSNKETISDWISPLAPGGDTSGIVDLPTAGTYMLEVAGNSGQRSIQPYELTARFSPAVDAFEPNNTFGSAAAFPLGESVQANFLPRADADWFRIEVDHHGELSIDVTDVPEALAITVRVWNSDKNTISDWIAPLAVGGETHGIVDLPVAGTYYLEFVERNSVRSVEPFTVGVSFIRAADPNEDNNFVGSASDLSLDHVVQGNILPRGDSDWYRLNLNAHGELQIIVSDVPENLDINFRVWNSNVETISSWFAPLARGGNTTGFIDIPNAGDYYVEVVDGSSDARSVESFLLSAQFIPSADMGEPNNIFELASPAELDSTIVGTILPSNDTDWYRLDLTEGGDLYAMITNVAPKLEIVYRLWSAEEETLSSWVYPLAAGGNTAAKFPIAGAGVYYLQVADNRGNRSILPYLLRLSMAEIDPAGMTFTQTVTNTQTQSESESTVEEGLEVITTTTTILTTTTTIRASGDVSESSIITETDVLTDTKVETRTVTITSPTMPPPSTGGTSSTDTSTATSSAAITSTTVMTETEEVSETIETTGTSQLSPETPPSGDTPDVTAGVTTLNADIPEGEIIWVDGVTVVLPTGWQSAAETGPFRGLALNPDDLMAATPEGPRLWVLAPGVEDLEFTGMLEAAGDTLTVVEDAQTILIGDQTAIVFAVEESFGEVTVIRRYVYITTGDGEAYQFILEAPTNQWDEQVSLLEGILASVLIATN